MGYIREESCKGQQDTRIARYTRERKRELEGRERRRKEEGQQERRKRRTQETRKKKGIGKRKKKRGSGKETRKASQQAKKERPDGAMQVSIPKKKSAMAIGSQHMLTPIYIIIL